MCVYIVKYLTVAKVHLLICLVRVERSFRSVPFRFVPFLSISFLTRFLILQQIAHYVQRILQRFGIARCARILAGVKRRHAEDNLIRLRIVGAAIATWRHWAVTHEAVRGAGDLFTLGT